MEEWPFVGRETILRRLSGVMQGGAAAGIEIVGDEGVGKSRLALELIREAERVGRATEWVTASHATRDIPFGACSHLLPGGSATSDDPHRLLGDLEETLAGRRSSAGSLVLVVDDVQLLDDQTASLVHAVATHGAGFVILARSSGSQAPPALAALWKEVRLEREELRPLSERAVTSALETILGGPVAPMALRRLWRLSRGNPLFLRELVSGAPEPEALLRGRAPARQRVEIAPTTRLTELIGARLDHLGRREREAVELIATAGTVDLEHVERIVGPSTLEPLEERRVVQVRRTGNRSVIGLVHPLYDQVVADRLPHTRARRLKRRLADELEASGARRADDLLRLAVWRLDGGGHAEPGLYARAAARALASLDPTLAERLARAALADDASDLTAQLVLGRAMAGQHRIDEAAEVLERAGRSARTDEQIARVALARANLLFFRAGRVPEATAVLAEALPTVRDPDWHDELEALFVLFRAAAGDLPGVIEIGRRMAGRSDARPRAAAHALMYSSIANVMHGDFAEAEREVEIGLRMASLAQDDLPLAGQMLEINRAVGAAYAGDLDRALRLGRAGYGAALESDAVERPAMWGVILGEIQIYVGALEDARRTIASALALVRERDPFSVRGIYAGLASVLAVWLGHHDEARALKREVVDDGLARDTRSRILLDRARAWTEWARSGSDAAATLAREAADRAASQTHLVWSAFLYHDAVRLGRPDLVVRPMTDVVERIGGELVPLMLAHARALAAADGPQLDRVSTTFEQLGAPLFAAEAAAQAHAVHLRTGEPRRARISEARAGLLAMRCQGARTPPLADATPVPLTRRELEVARLAAGGLSSRAIADRLHVSVRTVDNHLGAVYDKLGAAGRGDLPALFGLPVLRPAQQGLPARD